MFVQQRIDTPVVDQRMSDVSRHNEHVKTIEIFEKNY